MEDKISESNLEKIALSKMSQMSFLNLMSLISSYRAINMITPSNPLYKYLCYYAPYRPKINEREQKILFKENQNYASMTKAIKSLSQMKKINKSINIKEKLIEFNIQLNKGLQRFQKVEINLRNSEYNKIVILIQKHIRSFLKRISVIRIIDSIIIQKCLIYIIKIQDSYRKFHFRRNFKVNHIINKILNYRKNKADQLKTILYSYEVKVHTKKEMIIREILNQRYQRIILIQNSWRNKLYRNKIMKIINLEKNYYTLTYPFYANKVQLKVCFDQRKNRIFQKYNFDICPIRKIFVLHINYQDLIPGKYYCQFFVDNYLSADRRFPTLEGKDGQLYNIIEFSQKGILNDNNNHSYKTGTSSYNLEQLENPNKFNFNVYGNYNNYSNSNSNNYNNNYNNINYGFNGKNYGNNGNNNYYYYNNNNGLMGSLVNITSNYNNYFSQLNEDDAFNSLKKNLTGKVTTFSNVN
jgi:hypothetical protein